MNYFELFGLKPSFQLDLGRLAGDYRQLQRQFHPDKFAAEDAQSQAIAIQKAAQINDAYSTLKDPLRRAQYLLSQQGIELNSEQKTLQDMEFLMQQISFREELEAIPKAADQESAIESFQATLSQQSSLLFNQFETHYQHQAFDVAADSIRKLQFFARLTQQLDALEEQLLDN